MIKRLSQLVCLCLGLDAVFAVYAASSNVSCVPDNRLTSVPVADLPQLMANSEGNSEVNRLASARALGWVKVPIEKNVCGGYFAEPYIPGSSAILPPIQTTPVSITATSGNLVNTGVSTLGGQVVLTEPGRIVTANSAHLVSDNGNFERVELQGDVLMREPGKVAVANSGEIELQSKVYSLEQVIYRMYLSSSGMPSSSVMKSPQVTNQGEPLSAWGKAGSVLQPPSGITQLRNVTYSTCPPDSRAWVLESPHIDLNQDIGRGYAYDAIMYSNGVPIFYTPFIDFPLDNRRQSGFLFPQFIFGSQSGFGFGLPYYFNLAPNYDDTFTPYFYTKRGFQLSDQFRYLTTTSHGEFNASFVPNDWEFRSFQQTEPHDVPAGTPGIDSLEEASPSRYYFNWLDQTQFSPNLSASVNYSRVSDDYYLQNYTGYPSIAHNQLLQQGQATYTADDWNFLFNMQSFQTLHPVNEAFVSNQYSMLPQLLFTSHLPIQNNEINYQWLAEYVNFNEGPNPGVQTPPPFGQRLHLVPGINLPLTNSWAYLTPTLQFDMRQYYLGDQPTGYASNITSTMPIFDIDSGLYFDRMTEYFGKEYDQTLEPRVFYLYVPFHGQNQIPDFDTALEPFSYNQLFLTNRFTGSDRIENANQVSFALQTRYIDQQTGDQKFFAGAGIITYFQDRRVTICTMQGCVDSPYGVGTTSTTEPTSPIVAQATYNFNPNWNISGSGAWDPHIAQEQNTNLNIQYLPLPNHVFNIGYNFVRLGDFYTLPNGAPPPDPFSSKFNLNQPNFSFAWPLNDRWSMLGSYGYSLNQNHPMTAFYGLGYNTCCWAAQVVVARTFTSLTATAVPQYDNGIYVQFALKGLGKFAANDPTAMLMSNIPGYQDTFGQV